MITEAMIAEAAEKLYTSALIDLPDDITARMKQMRDLETSELARFQLDKLLENAELAKKKNGPICQDTGLSSYKVKVGMEAEISGDIAAALSKGTAKGTRSLPAIPHSVHPVTRQNTGDGTGRKVPLLSWEYVPDCSYLEITARPIGGGGDLCSAIKMFTGSTSFSEVKKFILDTVAEAGCKPCPPMVIGVGLGGMFETVNQLAKEAYSRPLTVRNEDPVIAAAEEELLGLINQLGIGPMGLGGDTTCLAVNIEYGNTATYILPVAVKIGCWDVHRKTARLYNDGTIEYL